MTDEFGAFSIIVNSDLKKNELINSFITVENYNLVIDKWFAVLFKNTIEKCLNF